MRYGPPEEVTRRLVARHGGTVMAVHVLPDGELAYSIELPTFRDKVELLASLASYDARQPAVRRTAELAARGSGRSHPRTVARVHQFVKRRVLFQPELGELFSPTMATLDFGRGDCDDSARALAALLRSLGYRVRLRTLPEGRGAPRHVAAQVWLGRRWQWLETTIDGRMGEHPIAAAKRLGIDYRKDLV